jgi:hypothetical protein
MEICLIQAVLYGSGSADDGPTFFAFEHFECHNRIMLDATLSSPGDVRPGVTLSAVETASDAGGLEWYLDSQTRRLRTRQNDLCVQERLQGTAVYA